MSQAVAQVPGIKRTFLQRQDISIPGHEFIQDIAEISPDAPAFKHKHPGEEIIYVLSGTIEYAVDGKPTATYSKGDVLVVPANTVHSARNVGGDSAAELATYIVEKDSPLVIPA